MNLEYELTREDYIEYNIFNISYSKTIKRNLDMQRYLIPVLFLILPFLFANISEIPFWYWMSAFFITSVIWIISFPKRIKKSMTKRLSKMLDEGNNKGMLGIRTLSVTDEGLSSISEENESKTKWNAVEDIAQSKDYIFIYISAVMAYIIPKRVFKDDGEMNQFLALVNKFLGTVQE